MEKSKYDEKVWKLHGNKFSSGKIQRKCWKIKKIRKSSKKISKSYKSVKLRIQIFRVQFYFFSSNISVTTEVKENEWRYFFAFVCVWCFFNYWIFCLLLIDTHVQSQDGCCEANTVISSHTNETFFSFSSDIHWND